MGIGDFFKKVGEGTKDTFKPGGYIEQGVEDTFEPGGYIEQGVEDTFEPGGYIEQGVNEGGRFVKKGFEDLARESRKFFVEDIPNSFKRLTSEVKNQIIAPLFIVGELASIEAQIAALKLGQGLTGIFSRASSGFLGTLYDIGKRTPQELDPRVLSTSLSKLVLDSSFDAAKGVIAGSEVTVQEGLKLGEKISQLALEGAITIESVEFQGDLEAFKDGEIGELRISLGVFGSDLRSVSIAFDFKNIQGSAKQLADELVKSIDLN